MLECTRCRGSLVTRGELDSHTSLRKRLEEFEKRTLPGIYHFEDQGRAVSRLDGSRPPDDVFRHLCALLGLV
ncbi:MAG: hypothetical protein A3A30_04380 [Candidatus Terrybacteria bacterium RIFCSPLOWO2_01_FULL_48_14]|nr:MAG: hypothetical protein A3A30_04380 [Candidatus Terrybacteria bacterium RIFCSPLOWO2_01_FULL_48_14]